MVFHVRLVLFEYLRRFRSRGHRQYMGAVVFQGLGHQRSSILVVFHQ
jgi:hypothetical protein